MTAELVDALPIQRDRRAAPAGSPVLRIDSRSVPAGVILAPTVTSAAPLAELMPIRRNRRVQPMRRAAAFATACVAAGLTWLVVVSGVVVLGHTL